MCNYKIQTWMEQASKLTKMLKNKMKMGTTSKHIIALNSVR